MLCETGVTPYIRKLMLYIRSRTPSDCSRIDQLRRHLLELSWIVERSLYREESSVGEDGKKACLITNINMTNITVAFSDGVFAADAPFEVLVTHRA